MAVKWIKDRPYYYTYTREDEKVRCEYWGPALDYDIWLIIQLDNLIREKREAARAAEDGAIRGIVEEDRPVAAWSGLVELAYRATLEACGYHRPQRRVWRRKRMSKAIQTDGAAPAPAARTWTHAEVQAITNRAEKGDTKALEEFRALVTSDPWRPLMNLVGNPAMILEDRLIAVYAGADGLARKHCMEQQMVALRRQLLPPDPHPLERLLVERVAVAWLALHVYEERAARSGDTPRVAEVLNRRVDSAHRRFLSAVRALRDFRRLDVGALVVAGVSVTAPGRTAGDDQGRPMMPPDGPASPHR